MGSPIETTEDFLDGILHLNPTLNWKALKVGNEEAFLLSHVNGSHSVRDLVSKSNIPLQTSVAILKRLLGQGALIYERARAERPMSRLELALLKGRSGDRPAPMLRKPPPAGEAWKAVPVTGDVYTIPFPRVLAHIYTHRLNGVLEVSAPALTKKLRFGAGVVAGVESVPVVLDECLGRLFRKIGRIDGAQYAESLKEMARTRRKQGQILIAMGCLTEQELLTALRWQVEMKVLDVFSWPSARYTFTPQRVEGPSTAAPVDMVELLFKGARRRTPFELVKREIKPFLDGGVQLDASQRPLLSHVTMSRHDQAFIEQIVGGVRCLRDALPTSSTGAHHLVFALSVIGVIRFAAQGAGTCR